jgi:hypothetical protein
MTFMPIFRETTSGSFVAIFDSNCSMVYACWIKWYISKFSL